MVRVGYKRYNRRPRRYGGRRYRLSSFLFFFRKFYNIKYYKHLIWLYKARKHFEFCLSFYFSKLFLQLNLNKIYSLPIYTWYKYKYYNISNFYAKYLLDLDNFYFLSFLKKYFYISKKFNIKNIFWSGGLTYLLFFNEAKLSVDDIEDKISSFDEQYLNFMEIKDINYLNFFFETENDLNIIQNIDFNYLTLYEKFFFIEYYKIYTLLMLNRILIITFF